MVNEDWRNLPGLPDRFQVSSQGRVRVVAYAFEQTLRGGGTSVRHRPTRVLNQCVNHAKGGYAQVTLTYTVGGVRKVVSGKVHQLVARVFLRPKCFGEEINHVDSDKLNNTTENLEWVTRSENIAHSYASGLRRPHKLKTPITGRKGDEVVGFESLLAAQKSGRFTMAAIQRCLTGRATHHKGYIWTSQPNINEDSQCE